MGKKTKSDPTGQAGNRNKSTRRLLSRLRFAERGVKTLFRAIPKSSRRQTMLVNADLTTIYAYEFSAQDQQDFNLAVEFILSQQLLETQSGVMPPDWWWMPEIELPYRQGTLEEARDFNQMIAAAIAAGVLVAGLPPQKVPIDQVLMSEAYRSTLNSVQVSNFSSIKTLSEKTASQVIQRINAGIQAGETPTKISADISQRFNVAESDAKRISETEINKAYNDAKLNATTLLAEQTGLRAGVIHISALLPTTRPTHADRHGKVYTVADQERWWNISPNRINCKCTVKSVLIDKKGKVVQADMQ